LLITRKSQVQILPPATNVVACVARDQIRDQILDNTFLTSPLLLRAVGRRRAHPSWRVAVHAAGEATEECPSSSETVCSGTPAASMRVACLNVCSPTPLMPRALAAALIARSAFLGSTAVPLAVVSTRPV
jgi:hypothetical protein